MSYGDEAPPSSRRSGGGGFDLSNYKTVAERITEARQAYPEGRFHVELLSLPPALAEKYVAVKARFFRTPGDPTPGEGMAWEPVPGRTPYTKDSELQNAETSAWGRALVAAFVVDTAKGIASREEVRNRSAAPSRQRRSPTRPGNPQTTTQEAPAASRNSVDAEEESLRLERSVWTHGAKRRLLEAAKGDKEKALRYWIEIVEPLGLSQDEIPPAEKQQAIVLAIEALNEKLGTSA